MASLVGINIDRTISTTFVMGAALAAVGSLTYILRHGRLLHRLSRGVKVFTASMLGGLLIALIEAFWSAYLLGKPEIEKSKV